MAKKCIYFPLSHTVGILFAKFRVHFFPFSKKVFTDSLGFRIPKKNFNYKDKNSSVLIIGDSVSFGVGVKEQNTFVGLMRNEFKNLNFFNSSVSGYNFKDYSEVAKKNKN